MLYSFRNLFGFDGFPPRRECGDAWGDEPSLGWIHIVSDVTIFLCYLAIPLMLFYFVYQERLKGSVCSCQSSGCLPSLSWHAVLATVSKQRCSTACKLEMMGRNNDASAAERTLATFEAELQTSREAVGKLLD